MRLRRAVHLALISSLLAACGESGSSAAPSSSSTTAETEAGSEGTSTSDSRGDSESSSGDPGTMTSQTSGTGPELEICGRLIECAITLREPLSGLVGTYGEDGTCWDEFDAFVCWSDCRAAIRAFAETSPNPPAECLECESEADCAIWDDSPVCNPAGQCTDGAATCETLSFASDIQPILDANCVKCHAPGGLWPSLDMTGDAYDDLVGADGIQTTALADVQLVVPGQVSESYIIYKLEGTQAEVAGEVAGMQMPLDMEPLDPQLRDTIASWIECGASP